MKPPLKKILIPFAFALNMGLTLYGFLILLDSPYTGIRMSVCGDRACVKSVDRDSPASGKVQPGDRLVDVAGQNISYLAFNVDVDYIRSERDQEIFWASQRKLNEAVVKGRPVELQIERNEKNSAITLIPVQFPFQRALLRVLPIYVVGWTFFMVAYLIFRKKENDISIVFLVFGFFICGTFNVPMPFAARDIAFSHDVFKNISKVDHVAALMSMVSLVHLALIFPKRKKIIIRCPWLIKGLYALFSVLVVNLFLEAFDNTYVSTYIPYSLSIVTALCLFIFGFIIEKNPVATRQIKWVMFGTSASLVCFGGLSAVPVMLGVSFVSVEISALPTVLFPLSFAFAVTKYKLMEIDNIIDTAVVYGFTILILAGVETTFLSFASPYLLTAGKGLPAFSVVAVLLIVFIYVPIRNFVKGVVERLFKRGEYDPEKELQQFTVSLGLCDERSALEKFTTFVNGLLRPSGIVVLKIGNRTATILHASNEPARQEGEKVVSQAAEIWEHVRNKGTCIFGYELLEKIAQDNVPFTPDLENALFVPFITDQDNTTNGYLAVLLKKWNETAYSVKDVTLLNAISVNIANIIEAGELRKERDEIEMRHRKEKDAVMKELHDGLGNILTSVTVTSQAAERMLEKDESKAKELVERIGEFSSEAVDFLRTGLTVLDNPRGDIRSLMEAIKDRFGGMFESSGMQLNIECSEEAGRLRPGAMIAMNLTRVIQETLNNVMKHSAAKRVRIRMEQKGDGLAATISDDGKGFRAGEVKAGLGIKNMQRRIEDMKGTTEIIPSTERGAEIRLFIPLTVGRKEMNNAYAPGDR